MRVHSIHVEAFGGLRDFTAGPDLPDFVVVTGSNEAGKSSFFEMLVALLYGFYPASRDRNPWAPWDGATARGSAVLTLDDGQSLEVMRRLLSAPAGSVVRQGQEESLRNETLPAAAHVSRSLYRQVFALTLGELASLEQEGWQAVQDRLLGAMGARDVRSARVVAEEMERAAGALWRPSRRGNQRIRSLDILWRELRGRRAQVRSEEARLREVHHELARVRVELEGLRQERESCRSRLATARTVMPARKALARIAELEAQAGPVHLLEGLPEDPVGRLQELTGQAAEADARLADLEGSMAELRARVHAYDDQARSRVERRDDVEALAGRFAAADPDRVRVGQLQQELRDLRRRLATTLQALAAEEDTDGAALLALAPARVRQKADDVAAALEALERARAAPPAPTGPSLPPWAVTGAGLAGLALAVAGLVTGRVGLGTGGLILVTAALVALVLTRRTGARGPLVPPPAELEARLREARNALAGALGGLVPVPPGLRDVVALPATLERAQDLVRDLDERGETLAGLEAGLERLAGDARTLAHEMGVTASHGGGAPLQAIQQALAHAEERRRDATDAERRLEALAETHTRTVALRSGRHEKLRDLVERLETLGDGEARAGADRAAARLAARRRAADLRDELARNHPPDVLARAREVPASPEVGETPDALAARERELTQRIEDLTARTNRMEAELEQLARRETLDTLDGEMAAVRAERDRLAREHDRLRILARVLRDADRWVREEHQPELLRRAGTLLATLTSGRYDRILVDADEGGLFRVRGPAAPHPIPVERPLSTGTQEQIYLALRLALLDVLDAGGERLPLILDEVLVNWDPERRNRGLDALAGIAERRQVFLLTCHPWLADAARARGACVVRLDGP